MVPLGSRMKILPGRGGNNTSIAALQSMLGYCGTRPYPALLDELSCRRFFSTYFTPTYILGTVTDQTATVLTQRITALNSSYLFQIGILRKIKSVLTFSGGHLVFEKISVSVCSCYNMISKGAVFAVNIVIKVSYILGLYVVTSGTQS